MSDSKCIKQFSLGLATIVCTISSVRNYTADVQPHTYSRPWTFRVCVCVWAQRTLHNQLIIWTTLSVHIKYNNNKVDALHTQCNFSFFAFIRICVGSTATATAKHTDKYGRLIRTNIDIHNMINYIFLLFNRNKKKKCEEVSYRPTTNPISLWFRKSKSVFYLIRCISLWYEMKFVTMWYEFPSILTTRKLVRHVRCRFFDWMPDVAVYGRRHSYSINYRLFTTTSESKWSFDFGRPIDNQNNSIIG